MLLKYNLTKLDFLNSTVKFVLKSKLYEGNYQSI